MPQIKTDKISIAGICCCLPQKRETVYEIGKDYFDETQISKTTKPIGVEYIYTAEKNETAADYCYEAADHLIEKLGWERSDVDGLIFISQTADYKMPSTSSKLHDRLSLSKDCLVMDTNYGCSAFVEGYFLAANLFKAGSCNKVLVLIGDTLRRYISPQDKGLTFIISDAASAIAFEKQDDGNMTSVIVKSDGSGADSLIIPAGAERVPYSDKTGQMEEDKDGNIRSLENFYMDGMQVFTFAIKEAPKIIEELLEYQKKDKDDIDIFLLHQANAYMLKYIGKRAKIPMEKIPVNISKYGNTNGSTLPLLLCDLNNDNKLLGKDIVLCGFGVGLSWGGVCTKIDSLKCSDIIIKQN